MAYSRFIKIKLNNCITSIIQYIFDRAVRVFQSDKCPKNSVDPYFMRTLACEDQKDTTHWFWETEEVDEVPNFTHEECEKYICANTYHLTNGRFLISLPFIDDTDVQLGSDGQKVLNEYQSNHYLPLPKVPNTRSQKESFLFQYDYFCSFVVISYLVLNYCMLPSI